MMAASHTLHPRIIKHRQEKKVQKYRSFFLLMLA